MIDSFHSSGNFSFFQIELTLLNSYSCQEASLSLTTVLTEILRCICVCHWYQN